MSSKLARALIGVLVMTCLLVWSSTVHFYQFTMMTGYHIREAGYPGTSLPFLYAARWSMPHWFRPHRSIATSYADMKDFRNAAYHYRRALKLKPDAVDALWTGVYSMKAGNYRAARDAFMVGYDVDPTNMNQYLVGYILPRDDKSFAWATDATDNLIEIEPDNKRWWALRGEIWRFALYEAHQAHRLNRAIGGAQIAVVQALTVSDADSLVSRCPNSAHAYELRAGLLHRLGLHDVATKDQEKSGSIVAAGLKSSCHPRRSVPTGHTQAHHASGIALLMDHVHQLKARLQAAPQRAE